MSKLGTFRSKRHISLNQLGIYGCVLYCFVDSWRNEDAYNIIGLTNFSSAHKEGSGGHATERKDSAGGKAKAKQEFPEAPDPAIGMQDERGGRGG